MSSTVKRLLAARRGAGGVRAADGHGAADRLSRRRELSLRHARPRKADIDAWDKDVRPDGMGLPAGSGTYKAGAQIYGEQCASCHGAKLEGVRDPNLPQGGGPALIGGRGTLNTPKFKQTVESYWPYASTLYDYILRAMPYTAPGSLEAR